MTVGSDFGNIGNEAPDPFRALIQEGYRAFACPRPVATGVCACCMDAQTWEALLRPELSAVPLNLLRAWFAASYERGGVPHSTWRYLLPRVLDALAAGAWLDAVGLEVSLNRAETGNPDRWSPNQWQILDRFQRLYLERCLCGARHRLDEVICMFSLGGWTLDELLAQVTAAPDQMLIERLWRDWCVEAAPGREAVWQTALWPEYGRKRVRDFYCSERMLDRAMNVALCDQVPSEMSRMAVGVVHAIERARNDNAGT
jgi:hypothetical protein